MFNCVYVCVFACTGECRCLQRTQESDPQELELQIVVNHLICVLEIKPRFSGRAGCDLNHPVVFKPAVFAHTPHSKIQATELCLSVAVLQWGMKL